MIPVHVAATARENAARTNPFHALGRRACSSAFCADVAGSGGTRERRVTKSEKTGASRSPSCLKGGIEKSSGRSRTMREGTVRMVDIRKGEGGSCISCQISICTKLSNRPTIFETSMMLESRYIVLIWTRQQRRMLRSTLGLTWSIHSFLQV